MNHQTPELTESVLNLRAGTFPRNYVELLIAVIERYGDEPGMIYKEKGQYRTLTYRNLCDIWLKVAAVLLNMDLQRGDRILIISRNRPEWAFADIGALLVGAITSAIPPTSSPEDIVYIVNDLHARFLFVENARQREKIELIRNRLPTVHKVFVFSDEAPRRDRWYMRFRKLVRFTEASLEQIKYILDLGEMLREDDPMTILYTAGADGRPWGVVLSHGNYLQTIRSIEQHLGNIEALRRKLQFLSPVHALERLLGLYLVIALGGCIIYANRWKQILESFQTLHPSCATAVPRFFEMIHAQILGDVQRASRWRQRLFSWALQVGNQVSQLRETRQPISRNLRLRHAVADFLVFRKVRTLFGKNLKFFILSGSSLNPDIAHFFHTMGIPILESWGLPETTALCTLNTPQDFRFGTVGKPLPGVEVRVAPDGNLLVRGPNVFQGYWDRPEETFARLTSDGFLRTPDTGAVHEEGWVHINARKRHTIVTARGIHVFPPFIEAMLIQTGLIEMAYVYGNQRDYLVALLVLRRDVVQAIAREHDLTALPWEQIVEHPIIYGRVQSAVDAVNARLPELMHIRRFCILPEPFTVEAGELTPSLKIRRRVIERRYRTILDSLYEDIPPTSESITE